MSQQTRAAVSWKELCSPTWAGDGQETGSWETFLGTMGIEAPPLSSLIQHACTHACRAHTQAHTIHTCAHTHMYTYLFSPKPGPNSQGARTPDLSQVQETSISDTCGHLISSRGQSAAGVAGIRELEAGAPQGSASVI